MRRGCSDADVAKVAGELPVTATLAMDEAGKRGLRGREVDSIGDGGSYIPLVARAASPSEAAVSVVTSPTGNDTTMPGMVNADGSRLGNCSASKITAAHPQLISRIARPRPGS